MEMSMPILLTNDNESEIKYVYHISDIHIQNTQRHDEYQEVFDRLYEKMISMMGNTSKRERSLLVVTGDIMHSKTQIHSNGYRVAKYFFKKISSICDVILIAGNHDCNLTNPSDLDALSVVMDDSGKIKNDAPILIKNEDNYNIYYLRDTGFYQYQNIIFGVTSMYDKKLLSADKLKGNIYNKNDTRNKYVIALFHGTIDKSEIDSGYKLNSRLNAGDFAGYDYVMLGDIHKFQYMNKEKTIAYSGSLIQQNHGETINDHGFLLWNLLEKKSKHYNIFNDYGYCTIEISNGEMIATEIPNKPTFRFRLENTTQQEYFEVKNVLTHNYKEYQITREPSFSFNMKHGLIKGNGLNIIDKKDINHTNIIKKYLETQCDGDEINKIIKIHEQICAELTSKKKGGFERSSKIQFWDIIELQFSDMLLYGKDNVIDFTKYDADQVIGIIAPNHYGKSSIVDILLFSLFGKWSRGASGDIIRHGAKSMSCSVTFRIGSDTYVITRTGTKSKIGENEKHRTTKVRKGLAKTTVNFIRIRYDDDGNQIIKEMTGDKKPETDKIITDIIGTYDDYVNTCVCLQQQYDGNDFVYMKETDRKEYLLNVLGISIFKNCNKLSVTKVNKLGVQINSIGNQLKDMDIETVRMERQVLTDVLKQIDDDILNFQNQLEFLGEKDKPIMPIYVELSKYDLGSSKKIDNQIQLLTNELQQLKPTNNDDIVKKINESKLELESIDNKLCNIKSKYEKLLEGRKCVPNGYSADIIENLVVEKNNIKKESKNLNQQLSEYIEYITLSDNEISNKILELKKNNHDLEKKIQSVNSNCDKEYAQVNEKLLEATQILDNAHTMYLDKKPVTPDQKNKIITTIHLNNQYVKHLKNINNELLIIIKNNDEINCESDLESIIKNNDDWITKKEKWATAMMHRIEDNNSDVNLFELETNVKNLQNKLKILFADIEIHKDNIIVQNNIKINKNEIDCLENISKIRSKIATLTDKYNILKRDIKTYREYDNNIKNNENIENAIKKNKNKIKKINESRTEINNNLDEYKKTKKQNIKNKDHREHLWKILNLLKLYQILYGEWELKIKTFDKYVKDKKRITDNLHKIEIKRAELKHELNSYKRKLREYRDLKKAQEELQNKFNLYNSYSVMTHHKTGIPYQLIKDFLEPLQNDINGILKSCSVDFNIEIYINEHKTSTKKFGDILININNGDGTSSKLKAAGGFQVFISRIAFRIALSRSLSFMKPNIFVIDEGWGCFDTEHLAGVEHVLNLIKDLFDYVLIISHIDAMKDHVPHNNTINICKRNKKSYIINEGERTR